MRTNVVLRCLSAGALLAVCSGAHAQLPDIRNASFDFAGTERLVTNAGGSTTDNTLAVANTFQVLDNSSTQNPDGIEILFPVLVRPGSATPNLVITATGTYNSTTGAFSVAGSLGSAANPVVEDLAPNGNTGTNIWVKSDSLSLSLKGTVSIVNGKVTIIGSDTSSTANNYAYGTNTSATLQPNTVTTPPLFYLFNNLTGTNSLYNWTATGPSVVAAVPSPSSLAVFLPGMGLGLLLIRRRARTA